MGTMVTGRLAAFQTLQVTQMAVNKKLNSTMAMVSMTYPLNAMLENLQYFSLLVINSMLLLLRNTFCGPNSNMEQGISFRNEVLIMMPHGCATECVISGVGCWKMHDPLL